jgi:hypothetical protein
VRGVPATDRKPARATPHLLGVRRDEPRAPLHFREGAAAEILSARRAFALSKGEHMRATLAAAAAVLAACTPRLPAAQEVSARWGGYAVEAVDEGGRTLPTFQHRGRTYVLGGLGQRYLLRFRNGTGRRVEVVASVDGRDVVDGRPASVQKRGYVVEPFGELTVDGFRTSADAVAAFRFSAVSRSYAARKGDARDVGVVGLAVFSAPGAARDEAERKAESVPPPAAAPEAGAVAGAPSRSRAAERPGLGTEFGEEHASHVEQTTFERASARPDAVLTFRYDDRQGLLALGIDVDGRGLAADEAWRRERASPFRADAAYCEPPPGWRAGIR